MVLKWRTKTRIARWMSTIVDDDMSKHLTWFNGLNPATHPHWVIYFEEKPIGLISLNWNSVGFYIGEDDHLGLGAFVPPFLYNWALRTGRLNYANAIVASVLQGNAVAMAMHKTHGFGEPFLIGDLLCFTLTEQRWRAQQGRFGHMIAEFE